MPSNARPERDRARQLYVESGGKTSANEIADVLSIPRATVQSWKRRDGWDALLDGKPPRAKGRKRSGRPRAPTIPAQVVNDAYRELKFESFTDAERSILEYIPYDPIAQQKSLIAEYEIRERRMYMHLRQMYALYEHAETEGGMTVAQEMLFAYVKSGAQQEDGKAKPEGGTVTKIKRPVLEQILAVEDTLTKIQKLKQDAINNLHRMQTSAVTLEYERRKLMATEARVDIEKERHAADTSNHDVEDLSPIVQMLGLEENNSGDH